MRKDKDMSIVVNYPNDKESLNALNARKSSIIINILKEHYGELVFEKYVSSIRDNRKK